MARDRGGATADDFRTLFAAGATGGLTDGQLLDQFAADGDSAESAFAALVDRHGAMVLRVCAAVAGDRHDAEDAYQATFLVLARRAASIRNRDSVSSWLHGVARRVALLARTTAARRRAHERRAAAASDLALKAPPWDDTAATVHEEVGRLPERYRSAVVLCDLQGLTEGQAAIRLGLPIGTVRSRLARGRERLRPRLSRRGLAPDLAPLPSPAGIAPPPARPIAEAASRVARRRSPDDLVSPSAISLAATHLRSLSMIRTVSFALAGTSLLGVLGALLNGPRDDRTPPAAPASALAAAPEPARRLSASDVVASWEPDLKCEGKDLQTLGGSPEAARDVAAVSFRLSGCTFEDVWNHYADKCGVSARYAEKTVYATTGTGPKGSYVYADRFTSLEAGATRGVTVFLLKTSDYTATVSFCPTPDGKAITGSITAVLRPSER